MEIGYKLCSEEHGPDQLIRYAIRAEEAGFSFAMISDPFHPRTDRQGQSPFVWSVIGAISQVTKKLRIGTGVTCPTMRIHPAIIAQVSARGCKQGLSKQRLKHLWLMSKVLKKEKKNDGPRTTCYLSE
jgi:G6PDH family F420-dependent oxidoreductase